MTVGTPDYNLDTFGIKYVKKAKEAHESGGDSGITSRTTSNLSNQDIATSGFGDRQSDSVGDTSRIEGATQGGKDETGKHTQAMTSSGKLGDKHGKKVGTEASHDSGIKDPYSGQKRDASGNPNVYKKPEGVALPKNASLDLAIIKCKLLKLKGFGGDTKLNSRNQKPLDPNSDDDRSFGEIRAQEGTPKEKGTGDKIPHEKLGDLPQGKDDKKVGGTEIEDKDGKSRKLQSPADRYKSEVREMAIDAIDMAMKTIAIYQDNKEKAIQEELIKEAYEAQEKLADAGGITTSDGVNAVYSDVHQKKINKE